MFIKVLYITKHTFFFQFVSIITYSFTVYQFKSFNKWPKNKTEHITKHISISIQDICRCWCKPQFCFHWVILEKSSFLAKWQVYLFYFFYGYFIYCEIIFFSWELNFLVFWKKKQHFLVAASIFGCRVSVWVYI